MTKKKDLYNLHCRIEHLTAEKLKAWSDELGLSVGELIDKLVQWHEEDALNQDAELEKATIYDQLSQLNEKLDKIGQKVGVE